VTFARLSSNAKLAEIVCVAKIACARRIGENGEISAISSILRDQWCAQNWTKLEKCAQNCRKQAENWLPF
jgi:hypothetical protein